MRALVAALVLSLLVTAAAVAAPGRQRLAIARAQMESLDFVGALVSLEAALEAGDNDRLETRTLYRLLGEVYAALGRAPEAEHAFSCLLTLEPNAELSPGASPKITAPFEAAMGFVADEGHLEICVEGTGPRAFVVNVLSDPRRLVTSVRARWRTDAGDTRELTGKPNVAIVLPEETVGEVTFTAHDVHGNELTGETLDDGAARQPPFTAPGHPLVLLGRSRPGRRRRHHRLRPRDEGGGAHPRGHAGAQPRPPLQRGAGRRAPHAQEPSPRSAQRRRRRRVRDHRVGALDRDPGPEGPRAGQRVSIVPRGTDGLGMEVSVDF